MNYNQPPYNNYPDGFDNAQRPPYNPPRGYAQNPNPYGYPAQPPPMQQEPYFPEQFIPNPMTDMAMQYSTKLVDSGKTFVEQEIKQYLSSSGIKFYFSVDTGYVFKKLKILLFPFSHKDWSLKYANEQQLPPRYDINAPDLYIPTMAYVTYILVAGFLLGLQNRFSPEGLGILASRTLAWTLAETVVHLISLYIFNVTSSLRYLDLFAFSGYKFFGTILAVLTSLLAGKLGYYLVLIYCACTLDYFLLRSISPYLLRSMSDSGVSDDYGFGYKRKKYFMLSVATVEPLLMWWLSYYLL